MRGFRTEHLKENLQFAAICNELKSFEVFQVCSLNCVEPFCSKESQGSTQSVVPLVPWMTDTRRIARKQAPLRSPMISNLTWSKIPVVSLCIIHYVRTLEYIDIYWDIFSLFTESLRTSTWRNGSTLATDARLRDLAFDAFTRLWSGLLTAWLADGRIEQSRTC